jgi:hypothetical protein
MPCMLFLAQDILWLPSNFSAWMWPEQRPDCAIFRDHVLIQTWTNIKVPSQANPGSQDWCPHDPLLKQMDHPLPASALGKSGPQCWGVVQDRPIQQVSSVAVHKWQQNSRFVSWPWSYQVWILWVQKLLLTHGNYKKSEWTRRGWGRKMSTHNDGRYPLPRDI